MSRPGTMQGLGIVEFILALVLGALAMAGVWAVYSERSTIIQAQTAAESITQVFNDVDRLTSNVSTMRLKRIDSPILVGLSMDLYAQYINAVPMTITSGWKGADTLPPGVVLSGGFGSYVFGNAWGGTWSLATGSSALLANDLAVITLTKVPAMACTSIISNLSPSLYDTRVNGTLVGLAPARTATDLGRHHLRTSQATPLCAHDENTLVLRRMKDYRMAQMRWGPVALPTVNANEGNQFIFDGSGNPAFVNRGGNVLSNYSRIQAAYNAREAAQAAIP